MNLLTDTARLKLVARHRRHATSVSFNDTQALAHHCLVTNSMLHDLRMVCEAAQESGAVLNPHSLITWLDDNAGQLSPTTFTPVTEEKTDAHAITQPSL